MTTGNYWHRRSIKRRGADQLSTFSKADDCERRFRNDLFARFWPKADIRLIPGRDTSIFS